MFGLVDLFWVLRYRPMIIIWAALVAGVVAGIVGLLLPEKFESVSVVQVDSIQRNDVTGNFEPRVRVGEFLGQQAAVAGSRTVALEVIDDLTVSGDIALSDYEANWRSRTGGETVPGNDLRLWAADQLLRGVTIKADALESTLAIAYRADNPGQAARVSNSFANAYIETVLRQKQTRFARTASHLSDETKALAEDVLDAQRELAAFRDKSGILPIGAERIESAELEYSAISERLAAARADHAEAKSLLALARTAPSSGYSSLPVPLHDQSIMQAQARLGEARATVSRIAELYGEGYPGYNEAVAEMRNLETSVLAAIRDRAGYAEQRVRALEAEADALRQSVSDIQATRDAYLLLENRLSTSQDTFNLVASRSLQEALQSRVDPVQVTLLARAVPTSSAATPPLWMVIALGLFCGLAIGVSAAIALELFEGRVRSETAASQLLRTSALGVVELPVRSRRSRPSAADSPSGRAA